MSSSLSSASLTRASNSKCLGIERLPKTRSGKILRKTMRQIADGQSPTVPSTIEDPDVLDALGPVLRGEIDSQ